MFIVTIYDEGWVQVESVGPFTSAAHAIAWGKAHCDNEFAWDVTELTPPS